MEQQWQNDPDKWIWGFLYYNPDDKRLLVPKRIPIFGWTFNYANPYAHLFTLLVILLIAIPFFL